MSRFLKITGWHIGHDHQRIGSINDDKKRVPDTAWINVYGVDEICGTQVYKRDAEGNIVKITEGNDTKRVLVAATRLKILQPHDADHDKKLDVAEWVVYGEASEWVDRIERMILDDRHAPAAPQPLKLNDRGAWTSGEDYDPLDVVSWPADASRLFLCLKGNRSTSDGVLANASYWCEVTALNALLTPTGGDSE